MMSRILKMTTSLIGCLAVTSCVSGDFCDVVVGPLEFAPTTARQIVRTDRDMADQIEVQNVYGRDKCDWEA